MIVVDKKLVDSHTTATNKGFTVDVNKLKMEDITRLKAIYRAGEKHLKYFHSTMHAFKNPERRIKTFDTLYFEQALPEIAKILREYEQVQQLKKKR